MDAKRIEDEVRAIVREYEAAVNAADADRLNAVFWVDDARFSEVENHIPMPVGQATFSEISDWMRASAEPGEKQSFLGTWVFPLTEDVAYSVSFREELEPGTRSRVTFVHLRKGEEWRIIHAHFSDVP
jgi:ketosteroid isomerase-like protein